MEATMNQTISTTKTRTKKKQKRDRRLHTSTVRLFLMSFAIMAFIFTIAFTRAWGQRIGRIEAQSTSEIFKKMDLEALDGSHFTSEDLKDARITLFNVWGTTCAPCIQELPELEELNNSYAPGEIQVVGILHDSVNPDDMQPVQSHLDDARTYMEKSGAKYPTLIYDAPTYAFVNTNIIGTPTTFITDSEGNILKVITGSNDLEGWKACVDEVLATVTQ